MLSKIGFALIAFIGVGFSPAAAQEQVNTHKQAALELVDLTSPEKVLMDSLVTVLTGQFRGDPEVAQYEDVVQEWARKFMMKNLRPFFAALYMELLTEMEMRELINLYQLPVGRKAVSLTPELTQRASMFVEKLANEHREELLRMLNERRGEIGWSAANS